MRLAAVILIEDDRLTAFEIALKVHDDIHIGAPPCIDGLVRIAHHAQLRLRRAEQLDDVILQLVDILELIHMDVIKAALPLLADILSSFQDLMRLDEQIVKVKREHVAQTLFIRRVDIGLHALALALRQLQRALGIDERRLARRDIRQHGSIGIRLGVDLLFFIYFFQDALLILAVQDGEAARIADLLDILTQQPHTKRVDRGDPHACGQRPQHRFHPLFHLPRGLIGKRDGQDPVRVDMTLIDQIRDPHRDHACLAAARTGDDAHMAVRA